MSRMRGVFAMLAAGLFAVSMMGSAYAAAPEAAKGPVFGTVDVEQAFDSYDKKKELDGQLAAYAQELDSKLKLREQCRLLSTDEFNQLVALKFKQNPSADDQKKADALVAKSNDLEKELQGLQQKTAPTAEESARLKQLQDAVNQSAQALDTDRKTFTDDFTKRRVDMSKQVMDEVSKAVSDLAKEKGLSMVFNKSFGDVGLVVYSNIDLTDDVIKKLNKK